MSENAMRAPDALAPRWGRVVQVLALIFSLYVIEQAVEAVLWDTGHLPGAGYIGTDHAGFTPTAECGAGCVIVDQVARDSPLAKAGVAAGDHIRLDNTLDRDRHVQAGDRFAFTLKRGDGWAHREVTAVRRPTVDPNNYWPYVRYDLLTVSTSLFGVLILWRSGGRRTPLLLGLALMCFGLIDSSPQMWEEAYDRYVIFTTINKTIYWSIYVFFAAFSISFAVEAANLKLGKLKYVFLAFLISFYLVGLWQEYTGIEFLASNKLAQNCQ